MALKFWSSLGNPLIKDSTSLKEPPFFFWMIPLSETTARIVDLFVKTMDMTACELGRFINFVTGLFFGSKTKLHKSSFAEYSQIPNCPEKFESNPVRVPTARCCGS